jgi:hypothetical protein
VIILVKNEIANYPPKKSGLLNKGTLTLELPYRYNDPIPFILSVTILDYNYSSQCNLFKDLSSQSLLSKE